MSFIPWIAGSEQTWASVSLCWMWCNLLWRTYCVCWCVCARGYCKVYDVKDGFIFLGIFSEKKQIFVLIKAVGTSKTFLIESIQIHKFMTRCNAWFDSIQLNTYFFFYIYAYFVWTNCFIGATWMQEVGNSCIKNK